MITSDKLGEVGIESLLEKERECLTPIIKEFRKQVDALIQQNQKSFRPKVFKKDLEEAHTQVRIHLTNAKMWAGKMLESLGNQFPPELADKSEPKA